jgi:hypothetical protein
VPINWINKHSVTRRLRVDDLGHDDPGMDGGNPRMYELFEDAPKSGKSPTIRAFPGVVNWLKVAAQPVPGPWPPHQEPRPDPDDESLPVAVREPERP